MGCRAQKTVATGSFHRVISQWPKTHSPSICLNIPLPLKVHDTWE